ncbi:MAG: hemerythrin domain-containing protein [Planctomycetes bacterium]|nr:hemerythrin domain-containing protein [Planctomycetota bacterium]
MSLDLHTAMMGLHDDLAARFFVHQRALLDRDYATAAAELQRYRSALFAHAADEERLVLPRYEQLGGAPDAPVRLFLGEHENLRRFVDEFVQRTAALCERPDDRVLLELLDRQATFKNLVLHHDLRERNVLYPFLAARLSAAEQGKLLAARKWSSGG